MGWSCRHWGRAGSVFVCVTCLHPGRFQKLFIVDAMVHPSDPPLESGCLLIQPLAVLAAGDSQAGRVLSQRERPCSIVGTIPGASIQ